MKEKFDALSNRVIGCALRVHSELGPGLLENTYEQCLASELSHHSIPFRTQVRMPVVYRGKKIDCGYRLDMLVDDELLLELKSVESLQAIHEAQVLAYMKLAKIKTGLLINFNVTSLRKGIKRFVL